MEQFDKLQNIIKVVNFVMLQNSIIKTNIFKI